MRNSTYRDNAILTDDNGAVIALVLAADFVSEHEWGIKRLKSKLGLPEKPECFADNCIKQTIELRVEDTKDGLLVTTQTADYYDINRDAKPWSGDNEHDFTSAWDEGDFLIRGLTPKGKDAAKAIIKAFANGDACVFLGGGGVFQNAGLIIGITSRVPTDQIKNYNDVCEDRRKLKAAAEATGIYDRVPARAYFALSPQWIKKFESLAGRDGEKAPRDRSKHPVIFWLNPYDQENNNSGYFTVEELDEWLEGKGPVPGGRRARRARRSRCR